MSGIKVTDRETNQTKASIVGSAGLLVAAAATIQSIRGDRSPRIELKANPQGRYIVRDSAGDELGIYDAVEVEAPATSTPVRADRPSDKQIAFLTRLVANPPYELRNYAAHIGNMLRQGRMTRAEVSMAISRLTWSE